MTHGVPQGVLDTSVGPHAAHTESERAARQSRLQQAEANFDPLPFDAAAARAVGVIAAELRRPGHKPQARTYDALIAAIALSLELPVFTRNADDFVGISGLDVHVV